jgi:hypothetical protein
LDAQEVSQDLQRSKRRSVTGLTDLEIDRADVELVLGRNGSRTTPERIRREKHVEDLLGPARPPRMPINLMERLTEQQGKGLRGENYGKIGVLVVVLSIR